MLELRLLGTPEITDDGVPVTGFKSKKVLALFCYLAITGQPQARASLASLFWGELPESNAHNNLRKALTNLRQVLGPYIHINRQSVTFNQDSSHWLDVRALESAVEEEDSARQIESLITAVGWYRDDFLAGFYIPGVSIFEDWVLIQRARLRELVLKALHTLTIHFTRLGPDYYQAAIKYARQLLRIEPYQEEAHRYLMLLLALNGDRSTALAQYKACANILGTELGVHPGKDTQTLFEQIRDGNLEQIPPVPGFLTGYLKDRTPPVFVGRHEELKILGDVVDLAYNRQGQVFFIAGGPGRGKTALLEAFTQSIQGSRLDLLVAKGSCSAISGIGDSYAPWREILRMLAGDVEAQWKAGRISSDHARRLWDIMPLTTQALMEHGRQVIHTLVDRVSLLARMTASSAPLITNTMRWLLTEVSRDHLNKASLDQSDFYEQVTRILTQISETHPLMLILDDLQWIDKASVGLLFHLGRQLKGRRILILCALRPEEASIRSDQAETTNEKANQLDSVVGEFKLRFRTAWIDLAESDQTQGRAFIDAYLDSEPNHLDQVFRDSLFKRTAGHPLFTIEMLRTTQDMGNLALDSDGAWVLDSKPDWAKLPVQVENVIAQRIDRLDPELRDILTVASVEGERFSTQVIARVLEMDEQRVLHSLSSTLDKQHRLVMAAGELNIGDRILSEYNFAHILYRDYVYHETSPGERRFLHNQVGTVLEELYQDNTRTIASRLAAHFAGDPKKEMHYAMMAWKQAESKYAYDEVLYYLNRILDLTDVSDLKERYDLLMSREQIYDHLGERKSQEGDLRALVQIATALGDPHDLANAALRQANYEWELGNYHASIHSCQQALKFLDSTPDRTLEASIMRRWALSLFRIGDGEQALGILEEAVVLAKKAGNQWLEAECLRHIGNSHLMSDKPQLALPYFEKALPLLNKVDNPEDRIRILHSMAMSFDSQFEYKKAKNTWEQALEICVETGSILYENAIRYSLGSVYRACGLYSLAYEYYQETLVQAQRLDDRSLEPRVLVGIGVISFIKHEHQEALLLASKALEITRDTHEKYPEAFILTELGHCFRALKQFEKAIIAFNDSIQAFRDLGETKGCIAPLAGLAKTHLDSGNLAIAQQIVEEILNDLLEGDLYNIDQPLKVYFTCYQVLQENQDPRAEEILVIAHTLLQEWARKLEEEKLVTSFLDNVPENQGIQNAWNARKFAPHQKSAMDWS